MQLPGPDLRSQLLKHHSASGPEATMVVEKEGPGILSSTGGDLITSNPTSRTQSLQNIKTALAAELSGPSAPHRPPSPPCSDSPAVQPLSSPPL